MTILLLFFLGILSLLSFLAVFLIFSKGNSFREFIKFRIHSEQPNDASFLQLAGGSKIGGLSTSYTELTATPTRLVLRPALGKRYEFSSEHVVALRVIEPSSFFDSGGVRIEHCISDYPRDFIFWCPPNSGQELLLQIRKTGFIPRGVPLQISQVRGFPIRPKALLIIIVFWNVLCAIDVVRGSGAGMYSWMAVMSIFIMSRAIWKSGTLSALIMAAGHTPNEIRPVLNFMSYLSGLFSVVMGLRLLKLLFW